MLTHKGKKRIKKVLIGTGMALGSSLGASALSKLGLVGPGTRQMLMDTSNRIKSLVR